MLASCATLVSLMLTLPHLDRTDLPCTSLDALLGGLDGLVAGEARNGYVRAACPEGDAFVFIHNGRAYCAGMLEDGRFVARTVADAVAALSRAVAAAFVRTDLPLFLCTAVLFRKAPAAQLPVDLVDSESLLRHLREAGQDAVVVVRRQDAYNLVFCREGEPVVLYPAPGERFAEGRNVSEQLLEYCYASPADVALDLYHDIGLKPAPDAGKPLSAYATSQPPMSTPAALSLVVQLGGRVVFRFPIPEGELLVGRGSDNDIPLDNLSVSRRHARLYREGEHIVVEDLGSENGITVRGQRCERAELGPGDEVVVGKYTLTYARWASSDAVVAPARRVSFVGDVEETIAVGLAAGGDVAIEHDGQRYAMKGPVFAIGKDPSVNLRVPGLLVGGVHARIKRTRGGHAVEKAGGLAALKVNGVKTKEAPLKSGDEITIGRHAFRFCVAEPKAPGD